MKKVEKEGEIRLALSLPLSPRHDRAECMRTQRATDPLRLFILPLSLSLSLCFVVYSLRLLSFARESASGPQRRGAL